MTTETESRSREILAKIKPVFGERGFDGASMQHLARAAGMSVGNFYRYFPSKDAIVAAFAQQDLEEAAQAFRLILSSDTPRQTFLASLQRHLSDHCGDASDGPLWAEIDAARSRKPEVAQISERLEQEIQGFLIEVFARISGRPANDIADMHIAEARLVFLMMKSALSDVRATPGLITVTVRAIDRVLDDIVAASGATSLSTAMPPRIRSLT